MDTARLGRMTPAAQRAQPDLVRLSAEEPTSLYFEEFLKDGFNAWLSSYQNRFPGLQSWSGVAVSCGRMTCVMVIDQFFNP